MRIGVADTTFARINMGAMALDEIKQSFPHVEVERVTVPGFKDLPVACKNLVEKKGCDVVLALGMVGRMPVDEMCAHEANLGIQMAMNSTGRHVVHAFVHEREARDEAELFQICNSRVRKHALNAVRLVLDPAWLLKRAGSGLRQGFEDAGGMTKEEAEEISKIPRLGVVVSKFNEAITSKMERTALATAKKAGASVTSTLHVPGAFDTPIAVQKLLKRSDVDAVAVLGAVITGATRHDEVVAEHAARKIADLSLEWEKPVSLGVIGPGATYEAAEARAGDYARRAIEAALHMIIELKKE